MNGSLADLIKEIICLINTFTNTSLPADCNREKLEYLQDFLTEVEEADDSSKIQITTGLVKTVANIMLYLIFDHHHRVFRVLLLYHCPLQIYPHPDLHLWMEDGRNENHM